MGIVMTTDQTEFLWHVLIRRRASYQRTLNIWAGAQHYHFLQVCLCVKRRLRSAWASTQPDQSFRCPPKGTLAPWLPTESYARTLIRLRGCAGWSESSLCTYTILKEILWPGMSLSQSCLGWHVCVNANVHFPSEFLFSNAYNAKNWGKIEMTFLDSNPQETRTMYLCYTIITLSIGTDRPMQTV